MKSHAKVSETDLFEQIRQDLQLSEFPSSDREKSASWEFALVYAAVVFINDQSMESRPLRDKYAVFICRNCGFAHDEDKCPRPW